MLCWMPSSVLQRHVLVFALDQISVDYINRFETSGTLESCSHVL